ncbi:hypothetical protein [Sedimenticola thiotaurini]|uniref:Uncharacterized protein n=1 Tax=Sedimenticola thiotaurini TaxID=1543721 RepID=A0A0F7JUA7_9GAMM|nr:hypothetical protein [Sedimenticola thiotaurini]AKH19217.1 hypothetical protein AAY24_01390 [Sedimenticola thiotaurini]
MKHTCLTMLLMITTIDAHASTTNTSWIPQVQNYFMDVILDSVSQEAENISVHPGSWPITELESIDIYQEALAANTAQDPVEIHDVQFELSGAWVRCLGIIVRKTGDIDRFNNNNIIALARMVKLGNCREVTTRRTLPVNLSKYVIFPSVLPFGSKSGYNRYRSIKSIDTNRKLLACTSSESSPMTQGPLHAVAIYQTDNNYIVGWESATSSPDPEQPDYPVKINNYYDPSSIDEVKDNIHYFQPLNGRGQIVFSNNDCTTKTDATEELLYLDCYIGERDPIHPKINQISTNVIMKKVIDSRFLDRGTDRPAHLYDYVATEITITFHANTMRGKRRFSTGFEFKNNNPDSSVKLSECIF